MLVILKSNVFCSVCCSGVAALSSSSTSDITDPGSPFSTASTHSSNSESGDDKSSSYHSSYPSTPVKSSHHHRGSRWTTQDKPPGAPCSPAVDGIHSPLQDCRTEPAPATDVPPPRFAANDVRASKGDDSGERNFALGCGETAQSVSPAPTTVQTRSTIWNLNNLNNSSSKRFVNPGNVSGCDPSELVVKSSTCESSVEKSVACVVGVRHLSCDKKEASQTSKISPVGTICVSSAIQTRRASATRQCCNVVSNVFTNTGSSFAGANNEACKKDSLPESKSIMACESPQRHASENEMLKLGAPSSIQTRSTAVSSPPHSAAARNGIPSASSKTPPAVPAEETTGNSTVVSDKSRGWTGTAGIPEASKTCEMPPLTTIALTVPTYCILTKNPMDTHNNSLFTAKSLGSNESSPASVPAPRTYHWTSGTNALGTTLKASNFKPFLVTGNNLLAQRKCILLAAPTGPSLGSVAGVPSAVSNGVSGLIPTVKGSSAGSVATGGGNTIQLRILGKGTMVPNLPRTEPSESSVVEKRDSVELSESSPPPYRRRC